MELWFQGESVWTSKRAHNFPESFTTGRVERLGKVDKGGVMDDVNQSSHGSRLTTTVHSSVTSLAA